ncbi:MAG TPA: hypothetical protein VKX17_03540 [Planctomycetota bacterium]|nr:hypothetical protein [Planctomycetota bacterium]
MPAPTRLTLLCVLLTAAFVSLRAEDKKDDPASARAKLQEYVRLSAELKALFDQKKYAEAAGICRKLSELAPRDGVPHYNLACALAHQSKKDDALAELAKSAELGFSDAALAEKDEDLASLRSETRFKEILAKIKTNDEARVENGKDIPGVKTVEGAPAIGLRYRLRMSPSASKEKPQRLIVWMHPSGGSMNATIEALSPRFIKDGFALMVFTKKTFAGWSGDDAAKIAAALDDVVKTAGISDDRPILMGFSAGGQMALELWTSVGAGLGGLVLDAAYPVRMGAGGKFAKMDPPKDDAALKTPMFVLVGTADGGSQVWKQSEDAYKKSGIPLTIAYLEGRKHEWLFGKSELDALDKWLADLAAKPSADGKSSRWRPVSGDKF